MEKRTLLAIVLSMAVIMTYQLVFQKPAQQANNTTAKAMTAASNASNIAGNVGSSANQIVNLSLLPKKGEHKVVAGKDVKVETPLYTAVFSTRGASLKSFRLKKYSVGTGAKTKTIEMVNIKADSHLPLALTFTESSINMPYDVMFAVNNNQITINQDADIQNKRLVFTATYDKIKIEKTFSFHPDNYSIKMDVKVINLADVTLSQHPVLLWYSGYEHNGKSQPDERVGPLYYLIKDVKRVESKDLATGKKDGPGVAWVGFESKYFLAAMTSPTPDLASVSIGKDFTNTVCVALLGGVTMLVPPRNVTNTTFSLFIGPKEYDTLAKQNLKLENAVDFGFFKWLSAPILTFMKFLYKYIPNYGVGIIILTILIKLIFWPLGNISYRSMKKMQVLQPKMKELQEKYKNDRQKLGQETMALYKAHKVNPMSGCLPILVQLPVFLALFNAFQCAIELRHAHFFLWITDLSIADPYYVTPILMGVTMFIQQKMSPPPPDPTQAKIMMFLPLIFTFFFLNFSSGLVLYWLLNNVLSIGQQLYVNRKLA